MGLIRASGGTTDGDEELEGGHDEAASAQPRPVSNDSHFSVSARNAPGYRLHALDQIIVIGGNGHIIAVEHPGVPSGDRRRKGAMPVPVATLSKAHPPVRFLWGPSHSVLGVSGPFPGTFDVAR